LKLALPLLLAGCLTGDHYYVAQTALDAADRLSPDERAHTALPARERKTGKTAFVRSSTIDERGAVENGEVAIRARAPSRMILAGSILTWVGSAISIGGTLMWLLTSKGPVYDAGIGLTASAEPIMIAGTVLWIVGGLRHPETVAPGRDDVRYWTP
jgi:hypothetical protein